MQAQQRLPPGGQPTPWRSGRRASSSYQEFQRSRAKLLRSVSQRRAQSTAVDFRRIWWDKDRRGDLPHRHVHLAPPPAQRATSAWVCLPDCSCMPANMKS